MADDHHPTGKQLATGVATPAKKRSKWPERVWLLLGALLIIAGGGTYVVKRREWLAMRVTHRVMAGLQRADRIDAKAGTLRGFNVLVITMDTTRADHIACYGNRGVETPVIDGLAREGLLFSQAVTPSPNTLPAHCSLFSGLYPHGHGVRANGTFRLKPSVTTLAEHLQQAGYRTGAVISAFVLDSRFGLNQGFDKYDDDLTAGIKYSAHMFRERAAELSNERATRWLREHGLEKFFLWVHYFDPHAIYLPPEPFRRDYGRNLYDGEIAYVDSQIGALLAQLEELGVRERTLVILTADHGEGLGEHGEQTHSLLIHDSTMHVPMIWSAPSRLPRGKVLDRQTSLVDVVPTLLALLGEQIPPNLDGLNLCDPPSSGPRSVLIESIAPLTLHGWAPLVGIRREDYKYILAPTPELYDLRTDPGESHNLHDARMATVQEFRKTLLEVLGEDLYLGAQNAVDGSNLEMDEELRRHLSALGYVPTSRGLSDLAEAFTKDPKEFIHHWEKLQRAMNLQAQGKMIESLPMIEECVAEAQSDVFARTVLAGAYMIRGEYEKADAQYRRAAELEPNDETIRLGLASVALAQNKVKEADQYIEEALRIEPKSAQVYIMRGRIAQNRMREQDALALYRKAIEMDPGSAGPTAFNQIGWLHTAARRFWEAREAFNDAIRIDALDGQAHAGLANILQVEGKVDEAMRELAASVRFDPNQPMVLAMLGSLLSQKGRQDEAEEVCKRALELSPKLGPALNNLGLVYRRQGRLELAEEYYRMAIEHNPRLDAAQINLAQLHIQQGKTEEGMSAFEEALRVNPHNPIALANLGARHFNNGEVEQALRLYQRALQVDPDYSLVHKHIAAIYALDDRPQQVAYHLRRSLEIDPQQPDAEQMRYMLQRAEETDSTRPAEHDVPLQGDR